MGKKDKPIIEHLEISEIDTTWTTQVMVIGAVLGALTGVGAAYMLIQRSKRNAERPTLNASEGLRLGLLIFGLLRQVATLGDEEK